MSAASKPTPGPWQAADRIVSTTDSEPIAKLYIGPNAEADARLIAAAPELLEALQEVLAWLKATPSGYETVPPDSFERARAAVAKATAQ